MREKLVSFACRFERWFPAALGVLYVAIAGTFNRLRFAYELDPDEGFNLMKVMLVGRGQDLYREVWSDQPPGFTYLGVLFVRVFGESVDNVRLVTTLLAGLLVFSAAALLRRALPGYPGIVAAVACTVMLPATADLSRYSMSAMIGLPSIALAVAGLHSLVSSRSSARRWLSLAGALFAASLVVKLFTLFLVPVFAALLLWQVRAGSRAERARSAARACGYFVLGFVPVLLLGFAPALSKAGFEQLYGTHVAEQMSERAQARVLVRYLAEDSWLYALALAGLLVAVVRRNAIGIAFGAFALSAFGVVALHSPVWHHHCLLISVPSSVLAGIAIGSLVELAAKRLRGLARALAFVVVTAGLAAAAAPLAITRSSERERNDKRERQLAVDRAIRKYAPAAKLMVTARQIRAFRLGIPVPPELAVTSQKRFRAGQLSAERIRSIVLDQRPDVIMLDERWPNAVRSALKRTVRDDYRQVYVDKRSGDAAVYVRNPEPGSARSLPP